VVIGDRTNKYILNIWTQQLLSLFVLSSEYPRKSAVLKTTIKERRCGIRETDK
jgi:hypothetical protein